MPVQDDRLYCTTDPHEIRHWAEVRGGRPVTVDVTGASRDVDLVRVVFPDEEDENLREISWEEFFSFLEDHHRALLYQEVTEEGETSNWFAIVDRNADPEDMPKPSRPRIEPRNRP